MPMVSPPRLVILSPAFVWISRRRGERVCVLVDLALIRLSDGILTYYFMGRLSSLQQGRRAGRCHCCRRLAPSAWGDCRLLKNKAPYLATRCRDNRLSAALTDPRLPPECLPPTAG